LEWPRSVAMGAPPVIAPYMLFLFMMTIFFFVFLLFTAAGGAFRQLGLPPQYVMLVLLFSLVGGLVNIPITSVTSEVETVTFEAGFFGMLYPIPSVEKVVQETKIAVNVGGCLVPVAMSIYLLLKVPDGFFGFLGATIVVTIFCNALARPIPGLGISIPVLFPPLLAATSAFVMTRILGLPLADAAAIAYVSGALGVLIGADIMNLGRIRSVGSPMVSIGGAGTFDGIFLTGVLSVILFPAQARV